MPNVPIQGVIILSVEAKPDCYPRLSELIKQAAALPASHLALIDLASEALKFAHSGEITRIINDEVRRLVRSPGAAMERMQEDNFVLSSQHQGIVISVGLSRANLGSSVFSTPAGALLIPLTQKGFFYNVFELNKEFDPSVFDPAVAIVNSQRRHCGFGDYVLFPAGQVQEYAESGCVLLKIGNTGPVPGLFWEFDRSSGVATAAYAPDHDSTAVRHILRFLTEFGDSSNANEISGLLFHPYHYIRWEAARAIGRLQPDILPDILETLVKDPHPHVRNAAKKMLEIV